MSTAAQREHLAAARLWAANAAPYFATVLFAMSATSRPDLGTVGVDKRWRLYVDDEAVMRWTVEQFGAVLIHEAHHLLRSHAERAGAMGVGWDDHLRWNVAADFEINDDLAELPLPAGGLGPVTAGLPPGQMAETYYLQLVKCPPTISCGSAAHGLDERHEEHALADTLPGVTGIEADLIRQETATAVARSMNAGGHVPSGLARWAQAFLHPMIDWRRELAAHVRAGSDAAAGAVDYSYRRPSRRSGSPIGRSVILRALVEPVPRIAVIVDTSASMDESALQAALTEIKGILRARGMSGNRLTVASRDTAVRHVQEVFTADQVRLVGGGGTDLRAGLDHALLFRPRPDLVITLTDGYTPWPAAAPAVTVVAAVLGDGPAPPASARLVRIPLRDAEAALPFPGMTGFGDA
jgi:predicted metal-dependent peptidase